MTFPSYFQVISRHAWTITLDGSTRYHEYFYLFKLPTTHQLSATLHLGCVNHSEAKSSFATSINLGTYDIPTLGKD